MYDGAYIRACFWRISIISSNRRKARKNKAIEKAMCIGHQANWLLYYFEFLLIFELGF
jgi:hypothetical protein